LTFLFSWSGPSIAWSGDSFSAARSVSVCWHANEVTTYSEHPPLPSALDLLTCSPVARLLGCRDKLLQRDGTTRLATKHSQTGGCTWEFSLAAGDSARTKDQVRNSAAEQYDLQICFEGPYFPAAELRTQSPCAVEAQSAHHRQILVYGPTLVFCEDSTGAGSGFGSSAETSTGAYDAEKLLASGAARRPNKRSKLQVNLTRTTRFLDGFTAVKYATQPTNTLQPVATPAFLFVSLLELCNTRRCNASGRQG